MDFEKFFEILPVETKIFILSVLPYLNYYSFDKIDMIINEKSYFDYDSKMLFVLLSGLLKDDECVGLLNEYNISFSFEYEHINKEKKEFKYITNYIPKYNDKAKYFLLSPLDIVLESLKFCTVHTRAYADIIMVHDERDNNSNEFKNKITKINNRRKEEQRQKIEKDLYKNLSFSLVSFLEEASKIRQILLNNLKNNDICRKMNEDITPISFLLASFYYQDIPILNNISEKQAIMSLFKDKKITKNKIINLLDIEIDKRLKNIKKEVLFIKEYFYRYINDLGKEGIKKENITVSDILNKALNHKYTNSYTVDTLFSLMDVNIKEFDNLKELVNRRLKELNCKEENQKIQNLYNLLENDTKDLIEDSCKIYKLITKEMAKNNYNKKVLQTLEDVESISLFIAICYFDEDINYFFLKEQIDLDKILDFLKINVSKEDMEREKVDRKILRERFIKFVDIKEGKKIKVKDIIDNYCDKTINKSMIMENIIDVLTMNDSINFFSQLKEYVANKESRKEQILQEKIFHNMQIDVVKYLERTSGFYSFLKYRIKQASNNDLFSIALILSAVNDNYYLEKFMKNLGFNNTSILYYLSLNEIKYDSNILVLQDFEEFILVKEKREDITINDILKKAFDEKLVGSVYYAKFLKYFGYTFKDFKDFDLIFKNNLEKIKRENEISNMENKINHYNKETKDFIIVSSKIYQKLQNNIYNKTLIDTDNDVVVLSIILALGYLNNKDFQFFKNYNLDLNEILNQFELNEDFFKEFDEVDYNIIIDKYGKYLEKEKLSVHEIILLVLNNINDNSFLKKLVNKNYEKLKKEIMVGKPYEMTLTFDERIKILEDMKVDNLNFKDYSSLISFGDNLVIHSKYLNQIFTKVLLSDSNEASIIKINEMLNNIYLKKEEKDKEKKSIFKRFFAIDVTDNDEKVTLNEEAIQELGKSIEETLKNLKQEYRQYKELLMYSQIYQQKNYMYYEKSLEIIKLMEDDTLKKEDYNLMTNLDYLQQKAQRFKTTDLLIKQNLISVMEAIKTHNMTINALELARDVLIPLVTLQLSITKGRENERKGIELSQDVFSLFQTLLNNNAVGTQENMEKLKNSTMLNDETINLLNNNIISYLQVLNENKDDNKLVLERKIKEE